MDKDYEKLIKENKNLLKQANYEEVIDQLSTVCQKHTPWQVNRLYVEALYRQKQFTRAYNEAQAYETEYLNNDISFWVEILLANQLFIPARLVANQKMSSSTEGLLSRIRDVETAVETRQAATIQKVFKNFYHLGDQPEWKQQEIINEADHLPIDKYLQATKFIIRDPFVGIIIRNMLLKTLAALDYGQSVIYIGVDQKEHEVIPNKIQNQQYQNINEVVKKKILEKFAQDPIDAKNYLQQFRLQKICLYPLMTTIISDPEQWVKVLVDGESGSDSPTIKRIAKWQKLIQESLIIRQ
ncbi:hypothetical protein [uncultured Limosilactobacillus sp.]|uniref:hypothetical protein n=1 Tax=uncultured Limosilactobacillus sp. TaxID=2837629 RepID=UPI0025F7F5F5|nr:hypothetical protein [uncultured Limosilactobacillus sp.]